MQAVQALEIEITPVHHIEGARLGQQFVQDVDVVQFPVGNVDEARDVAAQIDQRVQFARCFGRTKRCPREQRKAQVDRGRIQRVDGLLQIHAEGLVHVKPARDADQVLRELGVDSPVARFVRIGQRAPGHRAANTQVVELRALGTKARFDVAQALAIGELCKCHAAELIRTTETAHTRVAAITIDDASEGIPRQVIHQLREYQFAHVHARRSRAKNRQNRAFRRSNRRQP